MTTDQRIAQLEADNARLSAIAKTGEALLDSIYELVGCNLPENWPEKSAYLAALAEEQPRG